jgi:hypothetical protein
LIKKTFLPKNQIFDKQLPFTKIYNFLPKKNIFSERKFFGHLLTQSFPSPHPSQFKENQEILEFLDFP